MIELREWLQAIVPTFNLLLILWGIYKVVRRNEEEWREKERRLATAEANIAALQADSVKMAAVLVKLDEFGKEIERMRNRLDRFLDTEAKANQ